MKTLSQSISTIFSPSKNSLVSPFTDFFAAGGAALLVFALIYFLVPNNGDTLLVSWVAYYLAFIVNYPHFAASYQLLYGDQKKRFFAYKDHPTFTLKLWWAGLAVPVIMIGYFIYAMNAPTVEPMGYLVNALYFFVGWHYIKQTFGVVVVLSSAAKVYYSRVERYIVLVPLYTLWFISYVGSNLYSRQLTDHGIPYSSFAFPVETIYVLGGVLSSSTLVMIAMFIYKYRKENKTIPVAALAGLISIFVWYVPLTYHPQYFFLIPFFHSLQYLLFISAYKRNQITKETKREEESNRLWLVVNFGLLVIPILLALYIWMGQFSVSIEDQIRTFLQQSGVGVSSVVLLFIAVGLLGYLFSHFSRRSSMAKMLVFVYFSLFFGFLAFVGVPVLLDQLVVTEKMWSVLSYDTGLFGVTLYVFFFTIFINIHHYFIDNVIWRRDNPSVREYLFN